MQAGQAQVVREAPEWPHAHPSEPEGVLISFVSRGFRGRRREDADSARMAIVTVRGATRVDLRGMAALTMAGQSEPIP